jgi:hypothetical protein
MSLTGSALGISIMRAVFFASHCSVGLGVGIKTLVIGSNDCSTSDSSSQIWLRLPLVLSRWSHKSSCPFMCRCHFGCYYITRWSMKGFNRFTFQSSTPPGRCNLVQIASMTSCISAVSTATTRLLPGCTHSSL